MDSRRFWRDLEETAKCPICSETLKDPKTLHCLHSFCLLCLDNLAWTERRRRCDKISCPICQTLIPIPEENTFSNLPTSFHLDRLKKIFTERQTVETCQTCNQGKIAISYCFVCQDYLCSKCDKVHLRLKGTKDHRSILLQNGRWKTKDLLQKPLRCAQEYHEKDILNHYCRQCNECICDVCCDEIHWQHYVVDIQQAAQEGKEQLNRALEKAEEKIVAYEDEMMENDETLETRKKEIDTARRNVKLIVKELITSLKEHETAVLTNLDDVCDRHQKSHAIKQRELELFVTRLRTPVELAKSVLRRDLDVEIMKEKEAITNRCKDLLNPKEAKPLELPFVNYIIDEDLYQTVQMSDPGKLIVSATDPLQSVVHGEGLTDRAEVVGKETNFEIWTRKTGGNLCYNKNDQVKVRIQGPVGEVLECAVEDKGYGRYRVTYTPQITGQHEVMVSINGQPLTDCPWGVQLNPPPYRKLFSLAGGRQFRFPCGIAISKNGGYVAVADKLDKTVQIFGSTGIYLRQFGDIPDYTKNLKRPYSVAFSKSGDIIVIQEDGEMIVCSGKGEFLNYITLYGGKPSSVSVNNYGELVVCDSVNCEVKILSHTGCKIQSFGGDPVLDGSPSFAIHHDYKYFVSYEEKQRVKVFSEDGNFLYDIGTPGKGKKQLNSPLGLAIDKFNNLIVCDPDGCRLQVFTLDGKYVTSIEGYENGFQSPQFVAVSKDGRLFFTDAGKKRVHIFIN